MGHSRFAELSQGMGIVDINTLVEMVDRLGRLIPTNLLDSFVCGILYAPNIQRI